MLEVGVVDYFIFFDAQSTMIYALAYSTDQVPMANQLKFAKRMLRRSVAELYIVNRIRV